MTKRELKNWDSKLMTIKNGIKMTEKRKYNDETKKQNMFFMLKIKLY